MAIRIKIDRVGPGNYPYVFAVGERHFQLHQFSGSRWELLEYKADKTYPVLKKWSDRKRPDRILAEAIIAVMEETR